jgi:hypothetical protein
MFLFSATKSNETVPLTQRKLAGEGCGKNQLHPQLLETTTTSHHHYHHHRHCSGFNMPAAVRRVTMKNGGD